MPTTIPYDPSLTLMSVVDDSALENVQKIAELQAPVDAANDNLNSLLSSKRSLEMTKTELRNLGVPTDSLDQELAKLNKSIGDASAAYTASKVASQAQITSLKEQTRRSRKSIESPVDYNRSEVKTMPLAADTMNMDVQYFPFESASHATQIGAYVSRTASSIFGASTAQQIANAAAQEVAKQVNTNSIAGTLVLTVTCTHKNASIVAPFVLHVDKAVKVWNTLFPGYKLDPTSGTGMMKIAMNESQEDQKKFSIISGTTFGSAFVALVHVTGSSDASDSLTATAQSIQATLDRGAWFAESQGKIGVDSKFANDVKHLLGQQNIQSKVSVITMGVVPSRLAGEKTEEAPNSLAVIQSDRNPALDTNSMMTVMDDYLKKAAEGGSGVPINYYLKDIDQKMLAQMWVAKYYPGKFVAIKYDDSEGGGSTADQKAKIG
ncbi:hypothetical protein CC79DRAFT_1391071 [Sarocladium strictum]